MSIKANKTRENAFAVGAASERRRRRREFHSVHTINFHNFFFSLIHWTAMKSKGNVYALAARERTTPQLFPFLINSTIAVVCSTDDVFNEKHVTVRNQSTSQHRNEIERNERAARARECVCECAGDLGFELITIIRYCLVKWSGSPSKIALCSFRQLMNTCAPHTTFHMEWKWAIQLKSSQTAEEISRWNCSASFRYSSDSNSHMFANWSSLQSQSRIATTFLSFTGIANWRHQCHRIDKTWSVLRLLRLPHFENLPVSLAQHIVDTQNART